MRSFAALLLLLIPLLAQASIPASTPEPPASIAGLRSDRITQSLSSASIQVAIVDEQGRPLPLYSHHSRSVALGQPSQPYGLQIENLRDERVRIVVSIDGLNPRTGKRAYRSAPGFVLDPGQVFLLKHMMPRKKNQDPAPLLLPDMERKIPSVISIAVFRERMTYPYTMPWSHYEGRSNVGTLRGKGAGVKWLPPSGAPFRPLSADPETILTVGSDVLSKMIDQVAQGR